MLSISFAIGVCWHWVWSIVFLFSQKLLVVSFLKFNVVCFSEDFSNIYELFGNLHLTFVVTANFSNDDWFWTIHK